MKNLGLVLALALLAALPISAQRLGGGGVTGITGGDPVQVTNDLNLSLGEAFSLLGSCADGSRLIFGAADVDTYICETSDDVLSVNVGGTEAFYVDANGRVYVDDFIKADSFRSTVNTHPRMVGETTSATNPGLITNGGDLTTGYGGVSGTLSSIVGGVEAQHINASQNVDAKVTASVRGIDIGGAKIALYEKDVDGTPASTITVTAAGTYYPWITATAGVTAGGTTDLAANATCTALDDPYACCTGSGTGTCGNLIDATSAGNYDVAISMSFSGTNSSRVTCCAYVNDAAPAGGPCFVRKLGTGGDVGSAGASAALALTASDEIDLRCTADGNGDTINIWTAQLVVSQ